MFAKDRGKVSLLRQYIIKMLEFLLFDIDNVFVVFGETIFKTFIDKSHYTCPLNRFTDKSELSINLLSEIQKCLHDGVHVCTELYSVVVLKVTFHHFLPFNDENRLAREKN